MSCLYWGCLSLGIFNICVACVIIHREADTSHNMASEEMMELLMMENGVMSIGDDSHVSVDQAQYMRSDSRFR